MAWWERKLVAAGECDKRPLRIGIPLEFYPRELSQHALGNVQDFLNHLHASRRVEIVEVNVPLVRHSLEAYYTLSTVEGASSLSRYTGALYGGGASNRLEMSRKTASSIRDELLGSEVKRRILLGTLISSER